jgi:NADH dehydrogenase (ubiquinone) flavoprotein 2
MIQLNDDYYECLTSASMIALLDACKAGKPPKMGKYGSLPMNGQLSCEGPQGKTSLFANPMKLKAPGAFLRDESELKPQCEPKDVKSHMGY